MEVSKRVFIDECPIVPLNDNCICAFTSAVPPRSFLCHKVLRRNLMLLVPTLSCNATFQITITAPSPLSPWCRLIPRDVRKYHVPTLFDIFQITITFALVVGGGMIYGVGCPSVHHTLTDFVSFEELGIFVEFLPEIVAFGEEGIE